MRKSGRSSGSERFVSRGLVFLALVSCRQRASARLRTGPNHAAETAASPGVATSVDGGPSSSPAALDDAPPLPRRDGRMPLRDGWRLVSSANLKDGGEAISTPGYVDRDWYAARVPSTVLAALVDAGVYRERYKG